ncbi:Crp/Fnr family transcriptional regulator [Chitinophaga horti]|uniref:Crp/Fnr family transcriptional regulator n=1 Tax=Chitinophaga horti TaxID=2920382 RepID=A0ABY6IZ63_9BACT|nr:Crp/Fnr family transcriptional regulator [Chitinophaga horti]UYQ91202.1 Crp/Fnr family transcriptional regulator [Chitinophaga horti]
MDASQRTLRAHIGKVVSLTDDEFADVLAHFSLQTFKKRQQIIQEGKEVKYLYFILSGLVKLVYTDRDINQHILSFAMEDWWETDFQAFYQQQKALLSLECIEDTAVYRLSLASFFDICQQSPKMQSFFLQKSIGGHISSQKRILSFLTSNAKERFDQLIETSPSLIQRVPKSTLAAYLGVSRETLSRFSR